MYTMNEHYNNIPVLDGFQDPQRGQKMITWINEGAALDAAGVKIALASVGLTPPFTQGMWEYFYPMELTAVTNLLSSRLARAYCSSAIYDAMLDILLRETDGKADWADVRTGAEAVKKTVVKDYIRYEKMWAKLENSFTKYAAKKVFPAEPSLRLEKTAYLDLRKARKPRKTFDEYLRGFLDDIEDRTTYSTVDDFMSNPLGESITRLYSRVLPDIVYRMRLGLQISMLAYQYRWAETMYDYSAPDKQLNIDTLTTWYPIHGKKAVEMFFETCKLLADKSMKLDLTKQRAVDRYLKKHFGTSLGETRATRIEAMKPLYAILSDLGTVIGDKTATDAVFHDILKLAE